LFDFLSKKEDKSWDEIDLYTGETPPCPQCGTPLVKLFVYSGMSCSSCHYGLDEDDEDEGPDDDESLSVHDAASIWASNGKDADYMFGYSWDDLEGAL
jgi:hypothetical protein